MDISPYMAKVTLEGTQEFEKGENEQDQDTQIKESSTTGVIEEAEKEPKQGAVKMAKCSTSKWGPVQVERRSTRVKDTRSSQEKAEDIIAKKNLEYNYIQKAGGKDISSKPNNIDKFVKITSAVGVNCGNCEEDLIKCTDEWNQFKENRKKHVAVGG